MKRLHLTNQSLHGWLISLACRRMILRALPVNAVDIAGPLKASLWSPAIKAAFSFAGVRLGMLQICTVELGQNDQPVHVEQAQPAALVAGKV